MGTQGFAVLLAAFVVFSGRALVDSPPQKDVGFAALVFLSGRAPVNSLPVLALHVGTFVDPFGEGFVRPPQRFGLPLPLF